MSHSPRIDVGLPRNVRRRGVRATRTMLAAGLTLALAACGGGGGDDSGVATLGDAAANEATTTTLDPEEASLAFAQCMRDNGIDFPDPGVEGSEGGAEFDKESAEFIAAEEVCSDLRPARTELSDEDLSALQDRFQALAECLRDRDWDVADPDVADTGGDLRAITESGDFDPEDPQFQADLLECQQEVGIELDAEGRA